MRKEIEFWRFVASRLDMGQQVVLLIVAESHGSSPGRAGYKMAVAADGDLIGSIGGGVMEVNLVEKARTILSKAEISASGPRAAEVIEQVHQKQSPDASGMICSGRQTVILKLLTPDDRDAVDVIAANLDQQKSLMFEVSNLGFQIAESTNENSPRCFSMTNDADFVYQERIGFVKELIIIGGGHCALALSDLMSKLDFRIRIFDDRPELNTIAKNDFADEICFIGSYDEIGVHIDTSENTYVTVMTLGYASDAVVIRRLIDRDFIYFGVLGSKAKMATLMKELRDEGHDPTRLSRIRTPIGLAINSRTPEEIAVSIAAEIIAVKNRA